MPFQQITPANVFSKFNLKNLILLRKNYFLIFSFVVILLLIGVTISLAYQNQQLKQQLIQTLPQATVTPSPVPESQPAPKDVIISPTPSPSPSPSQAGLKGYIVSVNIDPPFRPEGDLTSEEIEAQRATIANSINQILSGLDSEKSELVYARWESLPSFAIKADAKTLDYLSSHPLVKNIQEDKAVPYH